MTGFTYFLSFLSPAFNAGSVICVPIARRRIHGPRRRRTQGEAAEAPRNKDGEAPQYRVDFVDEVGGITPKNKNNSNKTESCIKLFSVFQLKSNKAYNLIKRTVRQWRYGGSTE